jgi:hypothetical protein
MGATSVTGTGTGDAHTRVAYLSSNLPQLELLETTTNPQNLLTTTSGGSGGGSFKNKSFNDFSVNNSRVYLNYQGSLVFETNHGTYLAGNFNGVGQGSKAIVGIPGWEGVSLGMFPQILANSIPWTQAVTATSGPHGVAFNAIVDLNGNDTGPFVIMVITNNLSNEAGNPTVDNNGFSGAAASVYDFNINDFIPGNFTPSTRNKSRFYIVNNLPGAVGTLPWFNNPLTLDILQNGGIYPRGGTQTVGYPNAKIASLTVLNLPTTVTDNGLPKGTPLSGIIAFIGDSNNLDRAVTVTNQLVFIDFNGTIINLLA